jgi:hypothetical protein
VWINPDGFRWIEVLRDERKMELTVNPSPMWSETNWFMDYILPVGLSGERHDQHSEPTNVEAWTAFRQPVLRVALELSGWSPPDPAKATLEAHMRAGLGEVWEENELWVNLLFHHVDPDGSLGIRKLLGEPREPRQARHHRRVLQRRVRHPAEAEGRRARGCEREGLAAREDRPREDARGRSR